VARVTEKSREVKKAEPVRIGPLSVGRGKPLCLFAGPCVIESERAAFDIACRVRQTAFSLGMPCVFKASYDKANRTSLGSFRGPGLKRGLEILSKIRQRLRLPVLSDVHTPQEARAAGKVLDVIQIPAFLCRQTDLILAAAQTGKAVNIKKGQFLAPEDMARVLEKARSAGGGRVLLTERGTSFGYHRLVNDFRSIEIMRNLGVPVVFDATHSVQMPGGLGSASGGQREYAPLLARCAVAAGADAVFLEVHPDPRKARSDGPNSIPLSALRGILVRLKEISEVCRRDDS